MSKLSGWLLLAVLAGGAGSALAQRPEATMQDAAADQVRMEVGQTRLMHLSVKVVRVSVADPAVADVQVVTPQQVLITAKSVGYTQLVVWGVSEEPLIIAVSITRNLDQLRSQFKELFPGEKIEVSAVGDLIVLSGTVSDLRLPARASEVAKLYTERLANLIKVTGDQQVQLDVRFAEVSRTGLRRAGVEFLWRDAQRGYIGGISGANTTPGQYITSIPGTREVLGPPYVPGAAQGEAFDFFFSTDLADFPFSAILSILSQEGLAKVLAEPSIVALSGQDAAFHAGGEVPIVVAQTLGAQSVMFKKFGIQLEFTPTVLSERTMSLAMRVEVSEPDPTAAVTLAGFQVPGFKTRSSETTIRLRDGQSFAVAGLLSDQVRSTINKVPGLGDLPILGALFRSSAYRRDETELLAVVTAHLVRPLGPGEVPLMPGEGEYNDPNDFELFFLGKISSDEVEGYEERRRESRAQAAMAANPRPATPATPSRPMSSPPSRGPSPPSGPHPSPAAPPAKPVPAGASEPAARLEGPIGPIGFLRM